MTSICLFKPSKRQPRDFLGRDAYKAGAQGAWSLVLLQNRPSSWQAGSEQPLPQEDFSSPESGADSTTVLPMSSGVKQLFSVAPFFLLSKCTSRWAGRGLGLIISRGSRTLGQIMPMCSYFHLSCAPSPIRCWHPLTSPLSAQLGFVYVTHGIFLRLSWQRGTKQIEKTLCRDLP